MDFTYASQVQELRKTHTQYKTEREETLERLHVSFNKRKRHTDLTYAKFNKGNDIRTSRMRVKNIREEEKTYNKKKRERGKPLERDCM